MENKLIIGNLKMNLKYNEIDQYIKKFETIKTKKFVICPSNIYIPYFLNSGFIVGSQDVCEYETGAYTGEVSAIQLASLGVKYCIVGHSERRLLFNESNLNINKKVKKALDSNLKVILCIGETLEEVKLLKKEEVLKKQLELALNEIDDITNIIVAYEPVWSIGTNKIPSNEEIKKTIVNIKNLIRKKYKKDIKVLYGGSVNEKNVETFNKVDEIDGFLIGSASINPEHFTHIINKII